MKSIIRFLTFALALSVFAACSDDDGPVTGQFSDLEGSYIGSKTVYPTNLRRDTLKTMNEVVKFRTSINGDDYLVAEIDGMGADILATNKGIDNNYYYFSLKTYTNITSSVIPQYIISWLSYDVDWSSIDRMVYESLTNTPNGKFDRKTGKMDFTYVAKIIVHYKDRAGASKTRAYDVTYKYFGLMKHNGGR